jgi:hypothetical protein
VDDGGFSNLDAFEGKRITEFMHKSTKNGIYDKTRSNQMTWLRINRVIYCIFKVHTAWYM